MIQYKKCLKCGVDKPVQEYHSAGIKKGKEYKRRTCIPCYSEVKKRYRQGKKSWYLLIKKNLSCEKCGYSNLTHESFSPRALQFHHYDNNKSFTISSAVYEGYSKEKIIKEIKKCSVLCARCHAEEHDKLN